MNKTCLVLFLSSWALAAPDANEVMKKNDAAKHLNQMQAQAVLTSGPRVKKFTWWRKLDSDGVHYKLMTRFHFPPEIKGEGILFLEHAGADPDVLLYLPSYKKIRRVESSAQSGSFMATEFSYTDVLGAPVSDFKYTYKKDEKCGAVNCFVIESTPVNEQVRARAGYDRRLDWVQADNFMVTASEYYDASGKLLKKSKSTEIKEVDTAQHKWMAQKLEMQNVATGKTTVLEFSEVDVKTEIPDSTFTTRNLEKGL